MNKLVVVLIAAALAGIALPAAAKPVSKCEEVQSKATATFEDTYVVVDLSGAYVYEETNGIDGLQRKDDGRDDTCGGVNEPDNLVL